MLWRPITCQHVSRTVHAMVCEKGIAATWSRLETHLVEVYVKRSFGVLQYTDYDQGDHVNAERSPCPTSDLVVGKAVTHLTLFTLFRLEFVKYD